MRYKKLMLQAGMGAVLLIGALAMTGCTKTYKPVELPTTVSGAGVGETTVGGAGVGETKVSGAGAGETTVSGAGVGETTVGGAGAGETTVSGAGAGETTVSGAGADGLNAGLQGTADKEDSFNEMTLMTETAPSFKETNETVYVTGDNVNLRASASSAGKILDKVSKGTALKRSGASDAWSKVIYQGQDCYISTQYVSITPVETEAPAAVASADGAEPVKLDPSWKYAEFSKIHTGTAMLYRSIAASKKGITVCVNAGHGTKGGSSVKTQCHPDGTAKVTGGTTGAGATMAVAISSGMQFNDGTMEAKTNLAMAKKLKDKLLAAGYDVLMIRKSDDVQLDNIARTVIANKKADCHIAIHWDSTSSDKGAFYMSVPNVASYRNMEPVKSNWKKHDALGENLVAGLKGAGVKIFSKGSMETDLTQTSYSTIPSVDIELGDKASDYSDSVLNTLADGLLAGVNQYFGK